EVGLTPVSESVEQPLAVVLRGALPDGRSVSVAGTRSDGAAKLTEVDGFELELAADGVLMFFRYTDRPGVVGTVGTILGGTGVNIAAMQVARRAAGGERRDRRVHSGPVRGRTREGEVPRGGGHGAVHQHRAVTVHRGEPGQPH